METEFAHVSIPRLAASSGSITAERASIAWLMAARVLLQTYRAACEHALDVPDPKLYLTAARRAREK